MSINNIFDVAGRAMSAQMVRLNTVASNMANAGSVATTADEAYRPMRPIFATVYADKTTKSGLSSVEVRDVVELDREPVRSFQPDHPLADAQGYVFEAVVNRDEEMVEMMEASRQYQNTLEVVTTLRTLMSRTVKMGQ